MGFLDYFRIAPSVPEAPAADVQSVVATPNRPYIHKPALDHAGLRKGMWAATENSVGIITGCGLDGIAELTVIKADGTTQMTIVDDKAVPLLVLAGVESLRQAYIDEIPESRRPKDTKDISGVDQLRAMGYINRSEAA